MTILQDLEACLAPHGLILRGGFHPEPDDGVPSFPDGRKVGTLLMVGNVGPAMWEGLQSAPEKDGPDPIDRWTRRVLTRIAVEVGAQPLFAADGPPWLPFQRWAQRAEPVAPSPLGILIHPEHGLWHAWRGAFAFAERLELPPRRMVARPCDGCAGRPCLSACPVGAFSEAGYDVARCVRHLDTLAGAPCMDGGCLARRACPVNADGAWPPAQARHHMQAFRAGNRR